MVQLSACRLCAGCASEVAVSEVAVSQWAVHVTATCAQVSQEDIDEHVRQREAAKSKKAASKMGGFGGPATSSSTQPSSQPKAPGSRQAGRVGEPVAPAAPVGAGEGGAGAASGEEALAKMMALVPLSELEKQLQAYQRKKVGGRGRGCAHTNTHKQLRCAQAVCLPGWGPPVFKGQR